MIKGGTGGASTRTGLLFEAKVSLEQVLLKYGYTINDDKVFYQNKHIATLLGKNKLYKKFLEKNHIDYTQIISKKLLPDEALLVNIEETKILFILELKFQEVAGSVDEKLQTCDFKNQQYKKLLSPLNIEVCYTYILNDWFKKPEYRDVLNYIESVGCHYFFNEVPLDFLKLPRDVENESE